jgi:hypothetical protein
MRRLQKIINWLFPSTENKIPRTMHLLKRLEREAGIPEYASGAIIVIHLLLQQAESYDWTIDDTIELGKVIAKERKLTLTAKKEGKYFSSPYEIMDDAFMLMVYPKFDSTDYELVKDALNIIRVPEEELIEKILDF